MKKLPVVLGLAAIGIPYCLGYWPARQARVAAEQALDATQANLDRAEARNRLYALQSMLVELLATVQVRNFGDAQAKATAFFDGVRAEARRPEQGAARGALESILSDRDPLTSALTQNDPAAHALLYGAMTRIRQALGESPLPLHAPPVSPSGAPSPDQG
jgi:hypothetical protein